MMMRAIQGGLMILAAFAGGFVCNLIGNSATSQVGAQAAPAVMRATAFELVDDNGTVRGRFGTGDDGRTALSVNAPEGRGLAWIGIDEDSTPVMRLIDPSGVERVAAAAGRGGATMVLSGAAGDAKVIAAAFDEGVSQWSIRGPEGEDQFAAAVFDDGEAELQIRDIDGTVRLLSRVEADGGAAIQVNNGDAQQIAGMAVNSNGDGMLGVWDSTGEVRSSIAITAAGNPTVSVFDSIGTARFEAGVDADEACQIQLADSFGTTRWAVSDANDTVQMWMADGESEPLAVLAVDRENAVGLRLGNDISGSLLFRSGSEAGMWLLDGGTTRRAELTLSEGDAVFSVNDQNGQPRVAMAAFEAGAGQVLVRDEIGNVRLLLSAPADGDPTLSLLSQDLEKRLHLVGRSFGGSEVQVTDNDGEVRALLATDRNGDGSLRILGPEGGARIFAGTARDNVVRLALSDESLTQRVALVIGADGSVQQVLADEFGTYRVTLVVDEDGVPVLSLLDFAGEPFWQARKPADDE